MTYSIPKPLILFVHPNETSYEHFSKLLLANGYAVMRATCISEAIQKTVEHLPQIIICNYQLVNYDAFQAYNIFENSILKNATPFVVIMEDDNLETIELGLELGIDNFIFTPFQDKIILKKLKILLTKAKEQKASVTEQFHKLFDDSPIGIVIIADNYIEKANNAFLKLIGSEKLIFHKQCLHDFFDIKSNGSEVAELKKCFKGLAEKCSIKNVALKNSTQQVDIHVSHFSIFTENKLIVQFVEKESTSNKNKPCRLCWIDEADTQNHCVAQAAEKGKAGNGQISSLTKREYQITSLSAQGFQIKEIAEELQLSSRTVEKHRSNIMRKTGANSIIEAIAKVAELHHN